MKKKMSTVGPFCKGCLFLGCLHASGGPAAKCCDYILIAQTRRGCPAGDGCTRKKLVNGKGRRAVIKRVLQYY